MIVWFICWDDQTRSQLNCGVFWEWKFLRPLFFYCRWQCGCFGKQMSSSEIPRPLLLSKHYRQGNVLFGRESSEEQACRNVGNQEKQERWGRAQDSQYQPVHSPHPWCCSGSVQLLSITSYLLWKTLSHHEWLFELDIRALCMCCPGAPRCCCLSSLSSLSWGLRTFSELERLKHWAQYICCLCWDVKRLAANGQQPFV